MYNYLSLTGPVGNHQSNDENDVEATDRSLRDIGAYQPLPEHADAPSRDITRGMTTAIEQMQEQTGLRVTGKVEPGDETERLINNRLLGKPRGAGLLRNDLGALRGTVGNWRENHEDDVVRVKRGLGAVGQLPEHPFDSPDGIIDAKTSKAIERFQTANGLTVDGWLGPGGETETALRETIDRLRRSSLGTWQDYSQREARARAAVYRPGTAGAPTSDLARAAPGSGSATTGARAAPNWGAIGPWRPAPVAPSSRPGTHRPRPHAFFPLDTELWSRERPGPEPRHDVPGLTPPRLAFTPGAVRDIERELLRREGFQTYVPEPGDPLSIPLTMANRFGRSGTPDVQRQNADIAAAIEKACREELPEADVRQTSGKRYDPTRGLHGREQGIFDPAVRGQPSYPDALVEIRFGNLKVLVVVDTFSTRADLSPRKGEQSRFATLDFKLRDENRIIVRMPKVAERETVDPKSLGDYMTELCRKLREAKDRGLLDDPSEKYRIEEFLKLIKKRRKDDEWKP